MSFVVNAFVKAYKEQANILYAERQEVQDAADRALEAAQTAAYNEYNAATRELRNVRDKELDKAQRVSNEQYDKAKETYEAALKEVVAGLISDGHTEEGMIIAWMVEEKCWKRWPGACQTFLQKIPHSIAEVNALKAEEGWCADYDDLMVKAMKDGVISGITPFEMAEYMVKRAIKSVELYSGLKADLTGTFNTILTYIPQDAVMPAGPGDPAEK